MLQTLQAEEEEGVVPFDELPALQSAVSNKGAGSIAWTSVVKAAICCCYF